MNNSTGTKKAMTDQIKCFTLFLFLWIGAGVFRLHGQEPSPLFHHYTTADGLASSEVYHIIQDDKGALWFGTDKGLARFNGYEFHTYTSKDGLSDNTVFKLQEDSRGRIWMQTYSGRLFYIEGGVIRGYKYNEILLDSTKSRVPTGFFVDSLENVIVSIQGIGEMGIDNKGYAEWKYSETNCPGTTFLIHEYQAGELLPTLMNAVKRHAPFQSLHIGNGNHQKFSVDVPFANRFNAIKLKNENILFAVGRYLYESSGESIRLRETFYDHVISMYEDSKQVLWIGTEDGVFLYDENKSDQPVRHYLKGNYITGILEDDEGGYWFSTLKSGVFYTPGYGIYGIQYTDEARVRPLSLASGVDSALYVGFWSGAMMIRKGNASTVILEPTRYVMDQPMNRITTFPDEEKIFLSCFNPGYFQEGKMHFLKSKYILGIKTNYVRTHAGDYFTAGSGTIFKFTNDTLRATFPTDQRINCLGLSIQGNVLVGSNRGVFQLDEKTGKLSAFHSGLDDIRVDDICLKKDVLVFATKGKGVLIIGKDTIFEIDESKGLCSDLVNKLIVHGNDIWCATNKGIGHIRFKGEGIFSFDVRNIQNNNGLMSDEISDLALINDTLYAAVNMGISFFSTKSDFENATVPPVHISEFLVNNTVKSFTGELKFNHTENTIQINFTGISYRSMGKLGYRYTLFNGKDTLSAYTNNREVQFFALPPGKYSFVVSAMNSSGTWSSVPAVLSFTIMPAWWQTRWFAVVIALLITLIIFFLYYNRMQKVRAKFEIEQRQASLQLTAIRAQMNPHFIFNVMNSIRNYMQKNDSRSAEKYLTSFSKLVRYTLDHSEAQEVSLEEELSALKSYTELEMQRFENGFEFVVNVEEGLQLDDYLIPSLLLQPFVENSIKHGIGRMEKGGKISLNVSGYNSGLRIIIEDNGIGMGAAAEWNSKNRGNHLSFGTSLTFERIQAYNKAYNKHIQATLSDVTDVEGKIQGARVEILIS